MTRTLLVTCAVLFALSQRIDGDCKVPPPPCQELAQTQVVFYGEVLEITSQPHFVGSSVALLSIRFNVLRAFKGAKEGPLLETFYYGADAVRFEAKKRYLVYAIQRPGMFLIVACTRTATLAANPARQLAEIDELAACSKAL